MQCGVSELDGSERRRDAKTICAVTFRCAFVWVWRLIYLQTINHNDSNFFLPPHTHHKMWSHKYRTIQASALALHRRQRKKAHSKDAKYVSHSYGILEQDDVGSPRFRSLRARSVSPISEDFISVCSDTSDIIGDSPPSTSPLRTVGGSRTKTRARVLEATFVTANIFRCWKTHNILMNQVYKAFRLSERLGFLRLCSRVIRFWKEMAESSRIKKLLLGRFVAKKLQRKAMLKTVFQNWFHSIFSILSVPRGFEDDVSSGLSLSEQRVREALSLKRSVSDFSLISDVQSATSPSPVDSSSHDHLDPGLDNNRMIDWSVTEFSAQGQQGGQPEDEASQSHSGSDMDIFDEADSKLFSQSLSDSVRQASKDSGLRKDLASIISETLL
jgi:hypothetical protein